MQTWSMMIVKHTGTLKKNDINNWQCYRVSTLNNKGINLFHCISSGSGTTTESCIMFSIMFTDSFRRCWKDPLASTVFFRPKGCFKLDSGYLLFPLEVSNKAVLSVTEMGKKQPQPLHGCGAYKNEINDHRCHHDDSILIKIIELLPSYWYCSTKCTCSCVSFFVGEFLLVSEWK